jgi:hypothetical protein
LSVVLLGYGLIYLERTHSTQSVGMVLSFLLLPLLLGLFVDALGFDVANAVMKSAGSDRIDWRKHPKHPPRRRFLRDSIRDSMGGSAERTSFCTVTSDWHYLKPADAANAPPSTSFHRPRGLKTNRILPALIDLITPFPTRAHHLQASPASAIESITHSSACSPTR